MREIEIYAGIEPIGGMRGVSEPRTDEQAPDAPQTLDEGLARFERFRRRLMKE